MKMLSIGTTGVASEDLESLNFTIKKGSRITITGVDSGYPSYGYSVTDQYGHTVTEAGFNCIIPNNK